MDNPILENNLNCIKKYNPKLAEEIGEIKSLTNNFALSETVLNEPNLVFNGIELHSSQGAQIEASKIFNTNNNSPTQVHIVFGLGLGYLFKEFCEKSKGQVILFEPNVEILRATLEIVDFSKELAQNNVKVVSDMETFKYVFLKSFDYNYSATFNFLTSYRELYKGKLEEIASEINIISGINISEFNTLKLLLAESILMMFDNLWQTLSEVPLYEYKDFYRDKTAVIVSAGPSLDNCIESIKKNRDKFVLFCVGTALKALDAANIKPDFLNIIEVNDVSGQVKGVDLSDVNLILEPYTISYLHNKQEVKKKLIYPSCNSHANNYWAQLTDSDTSNYPSKGTVSYQALCCAKLLGFKKIILVGQDLAFSNNQCYSKNAAYSNLKYKINPENQKVEIFVDDENSFKESLKSEVNLFPEEAYKQIQNNKIDNITKTLIQVKGVTGEMLQTQANYATFIEHFKEFAIENKNLELINTSMIGANIDGFENMTFDDAIQGDKPFNKQPLPDVKLKYNKNKIVEKLEKEIKIIEEILEKFTKVDDYINEYEKEFKRRRVLNQTTNKYFKLILSLYGELGETYSSKSIIYKALAYKEDLELQFTLKDTQDVDIESIKKVYAELKNYFYLVGTKLKICLGRMNYQKGLIIESINSESK